MLVLKVNELDIYIFYFLLVFYLSLLIALNFSIKYFDLFCLNFFAKMTLHNGFFELLNTNFVDLFEIV